MTTCSCGHVDDEHETTAAGFGACTVSVVGIRWDDAASGLVDERHDCPCFLFEHDPRFDGEPQVQS